MTFMCIVCVFERLYAHHVCEVPLGLECLDLELRVVMSCQMWVLGIQPHLAEQQALSTNEQSP